jgi:hypothetical protein
MNINRELMFQILMRYRVYAILQLIILVFFICRPVIPYIQYAVFEDYIAKNLCVNKDKPKSCCHGKCYLEKQLKKSAETSDTEGKSSNKKISTKEVTEFLFSHVSIPPLTEIRIRQAVNPKTIIQSGVVAAIFVPPKA